MADIYFNAEESSQYSEITENTADQSLAKEFGEQVEAFYALPRKSRPRSEVVFSPSGVTKCARELYYINTNAPTDEQPLIPWRERMSRNGTGSHDVTQNDYLNHMERKLKEADQPVKFRFLEAEINGERSYKVGDVVVKLRGRSDGKIGLLNENGEVIDVIGWEKKTKDKRKNLNKIVKQGQPQEEHRAQATAYALIWGIQKWIFEYEALQKPEWKELEPEKPDIAWFFVEVSREESRALLLRLAKVVQAIKDKKLPPAETDKCGFCVYKSQCALDGGYKG